jgi:hypothetical protein
LWTRPPAWNWAGSARTRSVSSSRHPPPARFSHGSGHEVPSLSSPPRNLPRPSSCHPRRARRGRALRAYGTRDRDAGSSPQRCGDDVQAAARGRAEFSFSEPHRREVGLEPLACLNEPGPQSTRAAVVRCASCHWRQAGHDLGGDGELRRVDRGALSRSAGWR